MATLVSSLLRRLAPLALVQLACATASDPSTPPGGPAAAQPTPPRLPVISASTPASPPAGDPAPDPGPGDAPPPAPIDERPAPPAPSACAYREEAPMLDGLDFRSRLVDPGEEDGSLPIVETVADSLRLGTAPRALRREALPGDRDGDCLSDDDEARLGTNPDDPDSDGDGWLDGPCNERRKLYVDSIHAWDEQEDIGDDELYLVVDDVRHPDNDLDSYWNLDDGDTVYPGRRVASRTRGAAGGALALVDVEGWEDDFEVFNEWTVDDLLFRFADIDLGAYGDGESFSRRRAADDDWDYELVFHVEIERFADPDPLHDGDSDGDGIKDSDEARVAADFGGIADPGRPDVFVEVDWMSGHALRTQAKREVVTRLHGHGVQLHVLRDEELPVNGCLSVPEARALYQSHFTYGPYNAFRYAVVGEQIWNDASGVAWGDMFLVDDSTWWIDGGVLAQAGTFIHELGHTLSLNKDMFWMIDSISWLSYYSAMNYTYQALVVDYSDEGEGGDTHDHNDWAVVNPAHALRWSFGKVTSSETGICN